MIGSTLSLFKKLASFSFHNVYQSILIPYIIRKDFLEFSTIKQQIDIVLITQSWVKERIINRENAILGP